MSDRIVIIVIQVMFLDLDCHLAQLVNVALVVLHALLSHVEMGGEGGQLSLVLRHLLDHLRQVPDRRLVIPRLNPFVRIEFFEFLGNILRHNSDMLMPKFFPEIIIFIENNFFHHTLASLILVRIVVYVKQVISHGL